jgi:hypothetical protein
MGAVIALVPGIRAQTELGTDELGDAERIVDMRQCFPVKVARTSNHTPVGA